MLPDPVNPTSSLFFAPTQHYFGQICVKFMNPIVGKLQQFRKGAHCHLLPAKKEKQKQTFATDFGVEKDVKENELNEKKTLQKSSLVPVKFLGSLCLTKLHVTVTLNES